MKAVRRTLVLLVVLAVAAGGLGAAYAVGVVDRDDLWPGTVAAQSPAPPASPRTTPTPDRSPTATPTPKRSQAPSPRPMPTSEPTRETEPTPKAEPTPEDEPEPTLTPGPRLLGPGERSDEVRDLQARLRQIRWFDHDVTGYYGDITATAVRGFQAKRGYPVTGEVDRRTLDRLHEMSREPTATELANRPDPAETATAALDQRCRTGRVLCIDKSSQTLRWVVDGAVQTTVDVRFGRESMPTREGAFSVFAKSRDHVSSIYDTPMPYAMFFSGGQAVHYSPDFAANGYNGASHGCVNVRDRGAIAALFDQVRIGDRVIVHWS